MSAVVGPKEAPTNDDGTDQSSADTVTDQLSATHLGDDGGGPGGEADESDGPGQPKTPTAIDAEDPEVWKPRPQTEDCPVCMVPLPLDPDEKSYWTCCGKTICRACEFEQGRARTVINARRAKKDQPPLGSTCAFCRASQLTGDDEEVHSYKEKARKGDAVSAYKLATLYTHGNRGVQIDEPKALELYQFAADLGNRDAMMRLAIIYQSGYLGEDKNKIKAKEYANKAIKRGKFTAHAFLAVSALEDRQIEVATRHWCLAAEAGEVGSMEQLWDQFYRGEVSKDLLERTLRRHKETLDEMDSEERERWRGWKEAETEGDTALTNIYFSYYLGKVNVKKLDELIKLHKRGLAHGEKAAS